VLFLAQHLHFGGSIERDKQLLPFAPLHDANPPLLLPPCAPLNDDCLALHLLLLVLGFALVLLPFTLLPKRTMHEITEAEKLT